MRRMKRVTMREVCVALACNTEPSLAADLPIVASIQAISNALRHARRYGYVESQLVVGRGNTSVWDLTDAGCAMLDSAQEG